MHTYLDLTVLKTRTGSEPTGLKLPYVVTIEKNSGEILSLARNWDEQTRNRNRCSLLFTTSFYLVWFYGFGLIHDWWLSWCGDIDAQLIDAGTLSNLPAGFRLVERVSETMMNPFSLVSSETLFPIA